MLMARGGWMRLSIQHDCRQPDDERAFRQVMQTRDRTELHLYSRYSARHNSRHSGPRCGRIPSRHFPIL